MFLGIVINLYCFCFLIRFIFSDSAEYFFHPFVQPIRKITDPILLFFKNNHLTSRPLHPLIPIVILLLLEAFIFRIHYNNVMMNLISLIMSFLSFLYKTYLVIFWIVFSSSKYYFYDELFNFLSLLYNKSFNFIKRFRPAVHVRNEPLESFLSMNLLFFLAYALFFLIIGASKLYTVQNPTQFIFLPLKTILSQMLILLTFLPYLIFFRILLSWFMAPVSRPLLLLHTITEPILEPFRRLNLVVGMIDLSPLVAFFALNLLIYMFQNIISIIP